MTKKVISIVGIGEVGGLLAALVINHFPAIQLHLIEAHSEIEGKILDLQHAATAQNIEVCINQPEALSQSDYILLTAGFSNPKGVSRNIVAKQNKQIMQDIFDEQELKTDVKIIIVTNPVDIMARIVGEILGHQNQVIGTGTSLDSFRLKHLLAEKFQLHPSKIEALVLGEHGEFMIPLYSQSFVEGKKASKLLSISEKEELNTALKNSATNIRKTESATKYGVAMAVMQILFAFEQKNQITKFPLSLQISKENKKVLNVVDDIFISALAAIENKQISQLSLEQLEEEELLQLKQACKHLNQVYHSIN